MTCPEVAQAESPKCVYKLTKLCRDERGSNLDHIDCPGHVKGSVGHVGPMGHVGHWTSGFM